MGTSFTPSDGVRPRTGNLLVVAATGALFLTGALMLADWLRDREAAMALPPRPAAPSRPPDVPLDPRLASYLGGGVRWGPVRRDRFGSSEALLVTGYAKSGPKKVFEAMLSAPIDAAAVRATYDRGPSAAVAFRSQATVGLMPRGAFLVRLPPDLDAVRKGRLRTESGAVTLAFQGPTGWEYVTWIFPEGLDLDQLPHAFRAPSDALESLGEAASSYLEPMLAFGGEHAGAPRTVVCRARGAPGRAVEGVASGLERRGWTRRYAAEREQRGIVRVLEDGRRQVWLTAAEGDHTTGIVSVVFGTL